MVSEEYAVNSNPRIATQGEENGQVALFPSQPVAVKRILFIHWEAATRGGENDDNADEVDVPFR